MKSKAVAAVAALALSGCGGKTAENATGNLSNQSANIVADAVAPIPSANQAEEAANSVSPVDAAADEAAVRKAVTDLYASYNKPDGPDIVMSRAFDKAWDRAVGKDGAMDADPFCQCQDMDKVSVKIRSLKLDGDHARVAVTVINFGSPSRNELGLVREDGAWRFDDIFDEKGASMKASMNSSKPGSWSIGAE